MSAYLLWQLAASELEIRAPHFVLQYAGISPEGTRSYTILKRFSVLVNFEVRVKDSVII